MPYRVTLTLVGGERTNSLEIYQGPTPSLGDRISVNVGRGATAAKVTGIRKTAPRSLVTDTVDNVDAQEF